MKFDMSHEGVLSKRPFGQSEASRNRFRNDQMGHMPFLVLLLDVFWNFMKFDMSNERVLSK